MNLKSFNSYSKMQWTSKSMSCSLVLYNDICTVFAQIKGLNCLDNANSSHLCYIITVGAYIENNIYTASLSFSIEVKSYLFEIGGLIKLIDLEMDIPKVPQFAIVSIKYPIQLLCPPQFIQYSVISLAFLG